MPSSPVIPITTVEQTASDAWSATGKFTTPYLLHHWYVACTAKELAKKNTVASKVCGVPMVIFRDAQGRATALLDRCPHRNVPLSKGTVERGEIICYYHGWQFNERGERTQIPGLENNTGQSHTCNVPNFSCMEQDGFIWVCPQQGHIPDTAPYKLPAYGEGYLRLELDYDLKSNLYAALENALDVAHTSYIHRGLLRGNRDRCQVTVELSPTEQGIQAEYIGEKLLQNGDKPPEGTTPEHFDRFIMPSISESEYKSGPTFHQITNLFHTPIDENNTRFYFVNHSKMSGIIPKLSKYIRPIANYFIKRVIVQDYDALAQQQQTVAEFGGEDFQSCRMDVLGPHIGRFIAHAKQFEQGAVDTLLPELRPRTTVITI